MLDSACRNIAIASSIGFRICTYSDGVTLHLPDRMVNLDHQATLDCQKGLSVYALCARLPFRFWQRTELICSTLCILRVRLLTIASELAATLFVSSCNVPLSHRLDDDAGNLIAVLATVERRHNLGRFPLNSLRLRFDNFCAFVAVLLAEGLAAIISKVLYVVSAVSVHRPVPFASGLFVPMYLV